MKKFFLFLLTLIFVCCSMYKLEQQLDPESKEFLSKVRYIITSQERKNFLKVPAEKRKEFIEEFWKKRDPTPETEENEFKDEYSKRIEEANRLFVGGSRPGWLQDRGRVYIMYGPPTEVDRYPMGTIYTDIPYEVWYYGFTPIVFVDYTRTGDYELTPESLMYLNEIKWVAKPLTGEPIKPAKSRILNYEIEVESVTEEDVKIKISVPYKNIIFTQKDEKLETVLELNFEISGGKKKAPITRSEKYTISYSEDEIKKLAPEDYMVEIPLKVSKGNYKGKVTLENKVTGDKKTKTLKFSV
ncbi:MAG: GWxTD domain-containing protein [Acidobacteriota bacterium]